LHDGQKYGGVNDGEQIEYINHIGSVVFEILNAIHCSEMTHPDLALKCAILHDTIEDTPFTYNRVKELFGQDVADGVLALSKNDNIADPAEKMLDSLKRIKEQPTTIWAVKLADRITNLYAPPFYWKDDKKRKYIEESRVILQELKEGNKYLADRLDLKIREYHRFLNNTAI
jgi:(p)ppGpp synthase/HD superfamily hydrolase